jgi:predicted ATPase/DNA-binding SARP family transcriptional activator
MSELRFSVLGPVRAWRGDTELDLGTPQQRAVLAVLLLAEGRQVSLDALVDALWGQEPPRTAAGTVHTYVSRLRHVLGTNRAGGPGVVESAGDGYALPPRAAVLDLNVFLTKTKDARAAGSAGEADRAAVLLRDALALWQGEPLAGVPGEYARSQRVRLAELRLAALEERLALDIELGSHAAAAAELRALVSAHPLRERLSELLMLALYRSGRQAGALAVFDATRRRLARELGVDPGSALREMHQRVLQADESLIAVAGRDRGGGWPAAPSPVTALVGRDDDVEQVAGLLTDQDRRLVVLTGAGGIGKTRLALAVLERSRPHWRDGAAFADLSAVTDPALVPDAIAAALGLVVQGQERPLDTLARRLGERHMLIVVDNFEQVPGAAPALAELAQRAPHLHLLVTSRVAVRVRGAQEHRVSPLGVAPPGSPPAQLAQAPAVRLFAQRVRDTEPRFELTSANSAAVAELCRRLDGLPLALELAAASMRLCTPQQMLKRLYDRLEGPGTLADLPDRQQTLSDTLNWSYDLLPPPARHLLARLSVFAAPFTAEAAAAVSGPDGAGVMEALSTLVDHSMVSPAERPDGQRAFRLLGPVRWFAAARLKDAAEPLSGLQRYLLDVLEAAAARHGSRDRDMRRLDSERPNLQVVLSWVARDARPPGPLLRAIGDVWVWLLVRGHLRRTSGLWQQIESLPQDGLRTERDLMARSWLMACGLVNGGDHARAGALIDEILPAARRLEEPSRTALLLMGRAIARPYAAHSPARADFQQALTLAREAGDPLVLGYILSHYGCFLCIDGDVRGAGELHEEMLTIAGSLPEENMRAEAHYDLAMDAISADDPRTAERHLAVAVRRYRDIDHLDGLAGRCLGALSALALNRGQAHLAARLIGAAAGARASIGLTPWPAVTEAERRIIERTRALLAGDEFTAQVTAGRGQTIEDALAQVPLPGQGGCHGRSGEPAIPNGSPAQARGRTEFVAAGNQAYAPIRHWTSDSVQEVNARNHSG